MLKWDTLLFACLVMFFNLPLVFAAGSVTDIKHVIVARDAPPASVCIAGSVTYRLDKGFSGSDELPSMINKCAQSGTEYVMVEMEVPTKGFDPDASVRRPTFFRSAYKSRGKPPTKTALTTVVPVKNALIYDKLSNTIVRYSPFLTEWSDIPDQVDTDLSLFFETRGIKYGSGDEALKLISRNVAHSILYQPGDVFRDQPLDMALRKEHNELTRGYQYLRDIEKTWKKKRNEEHPYNALVDFLLFDAGVASCLRMGDCDLESIEIAKHMDRLFDEAPVLQEDVVVYRASDNIYTSDKSYIFATTKKGSFEDYGSITMEIVIPAGTPALFTGNMANEGELHQVILPRDGSFKILDEIPESGAQVKLLYISPSVKMPLSLYEIVEEI